MSDPQHHLPDMAVVGGATMTWWAWLAENHDQITAFCAIVGAIGVLIGIAFRLSPYVTDVYRWLRHHK